MATINAITSLGEPAGFQSIAASGSSQTLTLPLIANAALVFVETDTIRWRVDGTAPTSTVGMPAYGANTIQLDNRLQMSQFRFITDSSATLTPNLSVTYYVTK